MRYKRLSTVKSEKTIRIPINASLLPTQSERVLDLWRADDTELCVDGPVGCTKTVQIMLKILALHEKYPNFQSLVVRSEAKTLHTTIVPQLFTKIFRYHVKSKRNPFRLYGGENRAAHLDFDNGGRMTFGGMDDSGKILGSEYDLIFYNQAERERYQRNWQDLIGRGLEGRAGNWPHPEFGYLRPRFQIIADANPSAPTHWLKAREAEEQIRFISFTHEDNPLYYYDGVWTERGLRTREELIRRYTGYMRDRYVYGLWVSASGIVYTMFRSEVEIEERGIKRKVPYHVRHIRFDEIPSDYDWYCAVDYGSVNAFVCQLWAVHPNRERFILYKEIYHTGLTPRTFIPMMQKLVDDVGVQVRTVFTDHSASHNIDLRYAGFHVTEADKVDFFSGIELVKDMLMRETDVPGQVIPMPDVLFNSNSLSHAPDPKLFGLPHKTIDEFPLYSYREEADRKGDDTDEKPEPKHNHGMDAMRYLFKGVSVYNPRLPSGGHANFLRNSI